MLGKQKSVILQWAAAQIGFKVLMLVQKIKKKMLLINQHIVYLGIYEARLQLVRFE